MKYFYMYLIEIGEKFLMLDEENNLRTSDNRIEIQFIYTEWNGIFEFEDLQTNTIYKIENLLKRIGGKDEILV